MKNVRHGLLKIAIVGVTLLTTPVFPHAAIEEQITQLTARIEQQPDDPTLFLARGDQYRYHGDWPRARADYLRARGGGSSGSNSRRAARTSGSQSAPRS